MTEGVDRSEPWVHEQLCAFLLSAHGPRAHELRVDILGIGPTAGPVLATQCERRPRLILSSILIYDRVTIRSRTNDNRKNTVSLKSS